MTNYCKYGCGLIAKKRLSDGSWICSDSWNQCPINKDKNSQSVIESYGNSRVKEKLRFKQPCIYCGKEFGITVIKQHSRTCYLNPTNLKLCPVCNNPIKFYSQHTTCSNKCRGIFFKDQYTQTSRDYHGVLHSQSYTAICFRNHEKKCIVCDEDLIVSVHHYDENHDNNQPSNLIPLCLTHHMYLHSKHYHLVQPQVDEYIRNWKEVNSALS